MRDSPQQRFRAALMDPNAALPEGILDGHGGAAGRRFSIYRNNVAVGLRKALVEGFPTVARLIGTQNLHRVGGLFLRQNPPDSPVMFQYGAALPDFLEQFQPLAHLGYLPDAARLDLALRRAYHAGDASPIGPEVLVHLPAEELATARLTFAPAACVLQSLWPLHDIWRRAHDDSAPEPRAIAQDILVARPGYDPRPFALPVGGAAFIKATMSGANIDQSHAAAVTAAAAFDLGALLTLMLSAQAISSLEPAK